jgi:glc operon protein GlcG
MIVLNRRQLSSAGAEAVMTAAESHANRHGLRVAIAIVDDGGDLLSLKRLPGTQVASAQVAIDKARTAAIFRRPSREIEEQVTHGRLGALALRGAVALIGGIPLRADDEVVGAIGTSGESPDVDEAVSLAGAAATLATDVVPALTFDGARLAAEAARAEATRRGVSPVVAVVDAAGQPIYLWRPDQAQVASVAVAIDKARTAAIFRRASKDFEDQASGGRPSALHLAGGVPLQGGLPIMSDGEVMGAVGVSGASSAGEDEELAEAAVVAVTTRLTEPAAATFVDPSYLAAKFQSGGLVVDAGPYKVDAGRRRAPGEVEYHELVTDIMYVIEGKATVVTGGRMVRAREVAPGERRAESIDGGMTHRLAEGAVLVIPAGVPHHFIEVSDPFLYYVVKVEQ